MRKLILVNGDLATGKSHFAVILQNRFGFPLYTKDDFKERFATAFPYSTYEESHFLSNLAMEGLVERFKEIAPSGGDLILEANFRENYLKVFDALAKEYGYDILDINLVGTPEVLFGRYMNRIVNENRHPVHLANRLDDLEKFTKYTLARRDEKLYGKVITVNADDLSYQQDKKLLEQIEEFLKD